MSDVHNQRVVCVNPVGGPSIAVQPASISKVLPLM
jgi:hypothetical protein